MIPRAFLSMPVALLALTSASANSGSAQVQTEVPPVVDGAKPIGVERIQIHGTHLEGNLEGNAVDRDVIVFLPPSYQDEPERRYPVVYALHGYSIGAEQWSQEIRVPQTIEGAFALGARDMIVVLPDSKTMHNGSRYSSSVTTGDFERFVAHDVVRYIDASYRTIPDRRSRGLVGHSMGGYGATRIGMKHAEVFPRTRPSMRTCRGRTGRFGPRSSPSGGRTLPSPSSISTSAICAATTPSPSTSGTRTICGSVRRG